MSTKTEQKKSWQIVLNINKIQMEDNLRRVIDNSQLKLLFKNKSFNVCGGVIINNINLSAKKIIDEMTDEIEELIQDIGATNCTFFLRIHEGSYGGWITWHGIKYEINIGKKICSTSVLYKTASHSLEQLFFLLDRARKLEYLKQLCYKHEKSMEKYICKQ